MLTAEPAASAGPAPGLSLSESDVLMKENNTVPVRCRLGQKIATQQTT